ncbi:hypothetical protein CCLMGIMDO_CCLMGIMDO_00561 [Companilactobacillus crustorum]
MTDKKVLTKVWLYHEYFKFPSSTKSGNAVGTLWAGSKLIILHFVQNNGFPNSASL